MTPAAVVAGALLRERTRISESDFREIHEATARPLKSYLTRLTGDAALADDLIQETYFRYLRSNPDLDRTQLKSYLFRIATNLARDQFRRRKFEKGRPAGEETVDACVDLPPDLDKALAEIEPRERELILLAYVEGASHREIASITGLKEASVRPLLFRVRQKLAAILRKKGFGR